AARFLGVKGQRGKRIGCFIAGAVPGLSGPVVAGWVQIVSPESAPGSVSTMPILFALLGGAGTFWGPALGAVLFGVMDYGTRNLQGLADLTVGLPLLAVVLAIPGGITGLLSRAFARRRIGAKQTAKLANGEKAS